MMSLHPEHTAFGKSVDQNNPISLIQKPRGYSGTAIFYNKNKAKAVTEHQDGDHRVLAISLISKPHSTVIINVYMPCRGNNSADEEYEQTLDQISEIIEKYAEDKSLIIAGDWNCQYNPEPKSKRETALHNFILNYQLKVKESNQGPTFIHPNGYDCSTIDYFLVNKKIEDNVRSCMKIQDLVQSTSDHYPVQIQVETKVESDLTTNTLEKETRKSNDNINWEKIDLSKYQTDLDDTLRENSPNTTTIWDIEQEVLNLQTTITNAAQNAINRKAQKPKKAKKKNLWNPAIKAAVKKRKAAYWKLKKGKAAQTDQHILVEQHKKSKLELRSLQRIAAAKNRQNELEEIMEASSCNKKLFYKLVNKQRNTETLYTEKLVVKEKTYENEAILEGWYEHFSTLAQPIENENYDENYRLDTEFDLICIEETIKNGLNQEKLTQFTYKELTKAISSLNTGKAADLYGITAEHLKNGGTLLNNALLQIMNGILHQRKIPRCMKKGLITPVYKKKKEKYHPTNYRGITVVSVIGKLLEKLIKERVINILKPTQNKQQRGFTSKTSPMCAALLLHESMNEAKTNKTPLFIAFLDAKSAFDVVPHASLLRKLYLDGIDGSMWLLIKDTFQDAVSKVKWKEQTSNEFPIMQGVRQGGILSSEEYKRFNNNLLDWIQDANIGSKIGSIKCPSPTCADDVALVASNKSEMQIMLDCCKVYSDKERYELQPAKSMVMTLNVPQDEIRHVTFKLGNTTIPIVSEAVHLGITRDASSLGIEPTIRENLKKARRAAYALMGAGLHGINGITPKIAFHLVSIYILPIMLHGMEVLLPKGTQLRTLNKYYEEMMRRILGLPDSVAGPAVYILLGALPLQAHIDRKALALLGNILRDKESIEWNILQRQALIKTSLEESWVSKIKRTLKSYKLPNIFDLMHNFSAIKNWKELVKTTINNHWKAELMEKTKTYSSLRYLAYENYKPGQVHLSIDTIGHSTIDIRKNSVSCKILTGSYSLQTNRTQFNQYAINKNCLLCKSEPETRMHLILKCPMFTNIRSEFLRSLPPSLSGAQYTEEQLLQMIIDPSKKIENNLLLQETTGELVRKARNFLYKLNCKRLDLLGKLPVNNKQKTNININ
jgi:hypothetical protein